MKNIPFTLYPLLLAFLLIQSSCFQYPEGPFFTLQTRDERLQGTWGVSRVTDAGGSDVTNATDEGGNPLYSNITLTVEVSRSGERNWSVFRNSLIRSLGTYQFARYGDELVILYTFYNGAETYLQKFYTIRKLTEKEFIYVDETGLKWEFRKF
ncbi:MAG: hypothetical protein RMK52_01855 [Chitinophagales bacterium]|nr:hypothetical protein [Chitinophagales bacterium]MDW8392969.1 hypothetical protein [Chitinophagales bacterium]